MVSAGCAGPEDSWYRFTNMIAWSRIHCRAFSRLPAAIKFEFDALLLRLFEPSLLALLDPLNVECDDDVRPQRTGLSDARNEVVFDEAPEKRERLDDDEPADGVLRPVVPRLLALLMKSCTTFPDDELGAVADD